VTSHWDVLGLAPGASVADVQAARRRLAKQAHPDAGGSAAAMQALNAAADAALAELARPNPVRPPAPTPPPGTRAPRPDARWRPRPAPGRRHPYSPGVRHDHPSFTIELLPVEAFEALSVVAGELGDVIDDDPPYRLEVALRGELRGWCELTLVPDAGASTVSLAVAPEPGYPTPDVEQVRDAWVAALNAL
jgi:hypothetical protein